MGPCPQAEGPYFLDKKKFIMHSKSWPRDLTNNGFTACEMSGILQS